MSVATRDSAYINQTRQLARQIWDGINNLVELQRQWNALNYATTLLTFEGDNEGLIATDIGSVVFDTADALVAVLNAGHAANVAKLL